MDPASTSPQAELDEDQWLAAEAEALVTLFRFVDSNFYLRSEPCGPGEGEQIANELSDMIGYSSDLTPGLYRRLAIAPGYLDEPGALVVSGLWPYFDGCDTASTSQKLSYEEGRDAFYSLLIDAGLADTTGEYTGP